MKIELKNITVRDLVEGYVDKQEEGVRGYAGKLNIRPAYQREFIYKEKQRNEVIHTVRKNFPLNTMYWVVAGEGFELMDGQQRTISICQYVGQLGPDGTYIGEFSVEWDDGKPRYFHNLTPGQQNQILDYELFIYVCDGEESEKLKWFEIINIASIKLTNQELRNAIYTGPWLADAKRWFSKTGCPAYREGEKYVRTDGDHAVNRQGLLETAINWISGGDINGYMSAHQHDADAQELWQHFQNVINWTRVVFPSYRKEMKGLDWGRFYREHGQRSDLNAATLEARIKKLLDDDEVQSNKGIYEYLLTGNEKTLNLRAFDDKMKRKVYEQQGGVCRACRKPFDIAQMEADHIVPWHKGGKTILENCQILCMICNRTKGGR
ncbi:DUF262 domain-containing protein [Fimbriimonadia bacterium ATM]|nr:MAG: DUF262 domain-containing protein [Armatimonadota bacterium]MBC6969268.1 DUF262 domain-containing protein [Armatimonadota bacterium]MCE7899393.1 DUF262 domain-containing protein [Armatimonadetes bacterium ATM1]MDL1927968.1 DUF262 domain-containing protein [Fimbriimonadia bacterium ATM]RIJ97446.1 MAG: HNH endonuclease [Armatimonadota bacterium]